MAKDKKGNKKTDAKDPPKTKKFAAIRKRSMLITALIVVLLAAAGFFAYQYINTRNDLNKANDPNKASQQETQDLVNKLKKSINLPNEEPTLATVNDASKLKQQVFFAEAENGDKVLIYTNAKKAVLYRPSTKKVIEFAPVNTGESSASDQTPEPAAQ